MTNQLTTLDRGQADLLQMIDRAALADSTKAQYAKALTNYLASDFCADCVGLHNHLLQEVQTV